MPVPPVAMTPIWLMPMPPTATVRLAPIRLAADDHATAVVRTTVVRAAIIAVRLSAAGDRTNYREKKQPTHNLPRGRTATRLNRFTCTF